MFDASNYNKNPTNKIVYLAFIKKLFPQLRIANQEMEKNFKYLGGIDKNMKRL